MELEEQPAAVDASPPTSVPTSVPGVDEPAPVASGPVAATPSPNPTDRAENPAADPGPESQGPESQVPARIYPEYAGFLPEQIEAEIARLRNRQRALAIRLESCDRTLGQVLSHSHPAICAEIAGREAVGKIAALEAKRAEGADRGRPGSRGGDGIFGALLGAKRAAGTGRDSIASEGSLKVPEPIDRALVELTRSVIADPRIVELSDETVRASLETRTEILIESSDIDGRIRFLRRRLLPARLEYPRSAGEFRAPAGGASSGTLDSARPGTTDAEVRIAKAYEALRIEIFQVEQRIEARLADIAGSLERAQLATELERQERPLTPGPAQAPGDGQGDGALAASAQSALARIEEQLAQHFAALASAQQSLRQELLDTWKGIEGAQLAVLRSEDELRAGRLEVAAAQLAVETMRKQAAEAQLDADRAAHLARVQEEEQRTRVDAARHEQKIREQQDAHDKALELAAEQARFHEVEQTRSRESRTNELERMARLRSRAESAATARRIREAQEKRRTTRTWAAVVLVALLVGAGLLVYSGVLTSAAQYLRHAAASATDGPSGSNEGVASPAPPVSKHLPTSH